MISVSVLQAGQGVIDSARRHHRPAPFLLGQCKREQRGALKPVQIVSAMLNSAYTPLRSMRRAEVYSEWGRVLPLTRRLSVADWKRRPKIQRRPSWNHPPLTPAPMPPWQINVTRWLDRYGLRALERGSV
jgi:hypothetical protein